MTILLKSALRWESVDKSNPATILWDPLMIHWSPTLENSAALVPFSEVGWPFAT